MQPSLQNKLLASLLPLTLITILLTATFIYASLKDRIEILTDAQLIHTAGVLESLIGHEAYEKGFQSIFTPDIDLNHVSDLLDDSNDDAHNAMLFQVWSINKQLMLKTRHAPEQPLSTNQQGFSTAQINNETWRVYSLPSETHGITIQVALEISFLEQLKGDIAFQALIPILAMIPALILAIIFSIRKSTLPLTTLSQDIHSRDNDDLSEIPSIEVASEIRPLIEAFNSLLGRVNDAINNERRFTDNAAHELRTPLAGIRLQAQLAQKETDEKSRQLALNNLITAVDRTTHLVQQLLVLARLTPESINGTCKDTDIRTIAAQSISDHYQVAHKKSIELELNAASNILLDTNPYFISIIFNNLIGNALQYTPEHGRVTVNISQQKNITEINISDSGPGIAATEQGKVLKRFYRIDGSSGNGSGLGLAIVKRITDLYNGTITMKPSTLGGLSISVQIPNSR